MSQSQSWGFFAQREPVGCSALASCSSQAQKSTDTDLCTDSNKLWFLPCSPGLDLSAGELALLFGQLLQGIVPLPVNICVSDAIKIFQSQLCSHWALGVLRQQR